MTKTLVLKFGGASMASPEHISRVAEIIMCRRIAFPNLVVVVSAMGDATSELEALARRVHPQPPEREYDMLVSVGERISIALLAMALAYRNCDAVSFTGSQSGIITCCSHSNASIVDVRPRRLIDSLAARRVVIVAGFQGVSTQGEITTLGRGGSDTTAVALGVALNAEHVEFYKDVGGIYDQDPKVDEHAQLMSKLSYAEALEIIQGSGTVLHPRCVRLAKENQVPLVVRSFHEKVTSSSRVESEKVSSISSPLYEINNPLS